MAPLFSGPHQVFTMRTLVTLAALASCCVSLAHAAETTEPAQPTEAVTQQTNSAEKDQAATPQATTEEKAQPAKEPVDAAATKAATASAGEKPTKYRAPPGYKAREKDGERVYCQQQVVLGSRFAHETCFTEDQMKDVEARAAAQRLEMSRGRACGGPCTTAQ
jgi:hypothetical protein